MFVNSAFSRSSGILKIKEIIESGDSHEIINGLLLNNDSLITVILMGVFIAMFMTMIPQLTSMFFKVQISYKYYQTAKNDAGAMWKELKKMWSSIKK